VLNNIVFIFKRISFLFARIQDKFLALIQLSLKAAEIVRATKDYKKKHTKTTKGLANRYTYPMISLIRPEGRETDSIPKLRTLAVSGLHKKRLKAADDTKRKVKNCC